MHVLAQGGYSERKSVYAPHANLCVLPCQRDSSWEAWLRNRRLGQGVWAPGEAHGTNMQYNNLTR